MSVKHQLLFVQGGGKGTHDEWDNKLVASLRQELGRDYEIHYPRMPSEDEPSYGSWKTAIERALGTLRDGGSDLVGGQTMNDTTRRGSEVVELLESAVGISYRRFQRARLRSPG